MTSRSRARSRKPTVAERILLDDSTTLLDVVDNVLTKGVVLTGDLTIGLAQVDLVYARLSLLLCAADRVMPGEHPDPIVRMEERARRRTMRKRERQKLRRRVAAGSGG